MNIDSFENWNQCNRRELLTFISFFGVMGTIAFLLNGCRLSTGIRQITGEVLINGRRISPEQLEGPDGVLVPSDASISTGSAGSAVFVIGRDAFLIRGNSRLELKPDLLNGKQNEISGFDLRSGAILSVFVRKKRTLRTLTAVIGIRGTGVYLETDSEKTYVCTSVTGLPICKLRMSPKSTKPSPPYIMTSHVSFTLEKNGSIQHQ